jgi:radical SAM superfamily enzyme YgiQ (UPF0313 family)
VQSTTGNNDVLFVIGNIMATYGYQNLLETPKFRNVIAVIGEGEDAMVTIIEKALENISDISRQSNYKDIANVAIKVEDKICASCFKRIDLSTYPNLTIPSAFDIFDKEWRVYAIETSRGCPWGMCTFCSIKKQFGDYSLSQDKRADWRWKGFSLDKIFTDIENYSAQGAGVFDIKDFEFFGPMRIENGVDPFWNSMNRAEQFALRFSELNKKSGITLNHISARVDTIFRENEPLKNARRKEVYKKLCKSGLAGLYLGVESGSDKQLKRFGKGVTVKENMMAIEILREFGLNLEVGFIFFDPLADMEDLYDNICFIGKTELYKTDSRIFGSLRVQEGTIYLKMLENKGLLGEHREESLDYSCLYKDNEVLFIKTIYDRWELATIKLVRLLPLAVRLQYYELDYLFLRDILQSYSDVGQNKVKKTILRYTKKRKNFLSSIWNTGGLLNMYLTRAIMLNNAMLSDPLPKFR